MICLCLEGKGRRDWIERVRERSRRDVATCMFTVHIDYYTSV